MTQKATAATSTATTMSRYCVVWSGFGTTRSAVLTREPTGIPAAAGSPGACLSRAVPAPATRLRLLVGFEGVALDARPRRSSRVITREERLLRWRVAAVGAGDIGGDRRVGCASVAAAARAWAVLAVVRDTGHERPLRGSAVRPSCPPPLLPYVTGEPAKMAQALWTTMTAPSSRGLVLADDVVRPVGPLSGGPAELLWPRAIARSRLDHSYHESRGQLRGLAPSEHPF